ncbi:MAG: ATP-binding protein [Bacillaceae bacterium]|nr:ATP-binding protein [Bacillaceae bacterium]
MKYRDLIQFEPIESVVQLRESNKKEYAYQLLDTYVISERMAELINDIVIEQLQYDRITDNKGLLVVGNYGTGKSHLMSVIATIAELPGASLRLSHAEVAKKSKEIEGKFKVLRTEIGASTMMLRDIICGYLEDYLSEIGVDYRFPASDQIANNKDAFMEMMAAFHEVYPEQGLLLVVDELLDYLRGRREQEIILDLGFLREVGEICRTTRFRFIAGIQEMLFDNPKFQFVAEQLRRVRERFEQVSIVREDIAYVVSQRLLSKDEKQKALIREHLQKFTTLYDKLSERMEEFVSLFPIHPSYISTFEKVSVAEKRVILKTISNEMKKLLDQDVPTEQPGIISYDSYWAYIEGDASLKSNPDIREVINKSKILQDRIQQAFTKPAYKPVAMRIVQALSVHRLTTGDIYAKLGATSEELRDSLFLYIAMPEQDSEFLRSTVESVLKEILKTVSYQYISFNEANGQYYVDIQKDIAVDDLIEQKAEALTDEQLDRHFFEALAIVTESAKNTYVTNYRIWQHELPWNENKVTRQGYLFFGAPNERSTAQPPRDFYIYMIQPFDPPKYKDEEKADEVFFKLKNYDDKFLRSLKLYAGAKEMSITAATGTKNLYESKAAENLQLLTKWLRENSHQAFEVTYKGLTKKITSWVKVLPPQASVREIIDVVSATCLNDWFKEQYPDYPSFSSLKTPITKESFSTYIMDALKTIGGNITRGGSAILNGLVLWENEKLQVRKSGYAKWILDLLEERGQGQVINRSELVKTLYSVQGIEDIEQTVQFQMEPELLVVLLAALIQNGDAVVTINNKQYDAMNYNDFTKLPLNELINFSHIKKPSGLPISALKELFDLFNLNHGLLNDTALPTGIAQLQLKVQEALKKTVETLQVVRSGIPCWEGEILSANEQQQYKETLEKHKDFLQAVSVYNSPAKLTNFKFSIAEVQEQKEAINLIEHLGQVQKRATEVSNLAQYLVGAQQQLPLDHEWQGRVEDVLEELLHALKNGETCQEQIKEIQKLKAEYQDIYLTTHAKVRLNAHDDNRKATLLNNPMMTALKTLSSIEIVPKSQLESLYDRITSLKACWQLTKDQLENRFVCPHCSLRVRDELGKRVESLDVLETQLQDLFSNWTQMIINNLKSDEVRSNIPLLKMEQQVMVNELIRTGEFALPIEPKLIATIKELLQGIERVEITQQDLFEMMGYGSPLTVDEVRTRFEKLLREKIGSNATTRVRIMLSDTQEVEVNV